MSFNPYDTNGPTMNDEVDHSSVVNYNNNLDVETKPTSSSIDFSTMDAGELSKYAQENPEWYSQNSALVDYWLGEKSYYNRASQNIKSQYQQYKELGINPVLAMSLLGNSGVSLSGGQSSNSSSYFSSLNSAKTSEENNERTNQMNLARTLLSVGILGIIKVLLSL